MKKPALMEGHIWSAPWIVVPVTDILVPKSGRVCYGQRWWAVTADNEVLFFKTYDSPQCNRHKSIASQLGQGFGDPAVDVVFLEMAFIPQTWE